MSPLSYKVYAQSAKRKEMKLTGVLFLYQPCLHNLSPLFQKVWQFDSLDNASKRRYFAEACKALGHEL